MRRCCPTLFHSPQAALRTLLVAFVLAPVVLVAQGYFGTVSGELTDATRAVVQGARVLLTDQQKGFAFNTTSDSNGRYLFRSIPPGVYAVSAEAKGFEKGILAGSMTIRRLGDCKEGGWRHASKAEVLESVLGSRFLFGP